MLNRIFRRPQKPAPLPTLSIKLKRSFSWKSLFLGAALASTPIVFLLPLNGETNSSKADVENLESLKCTPNRSTTPKHVAIVKISGAIDDHMLEEFRKKMQKIAKEPKYTSIILDIDSPGGGAYASMEMHKMVMEARTNCHIPVFALTGSMAASGGYMMATSAEKIYARSPGSLIGSIGVIVSMPNASELMDRLGVKMVQITSGSKKAGLSPFTPVTNEGKETIERLIRSMQGQFWDIVKEGRGERLVADKETILNADVYPASEAKQMGLIDGIRLNVDTLVNEVAPGAKMTLLESHKPSGILSMLGFFSDAVEMAKVVTGNAPAPAELGLRFEFRYQP